MLPGKEVAFNGRAYSNSAGYRADLETKLLTAQHLAAHFTNSAQETQGAISDHKLQIQLLEVSVCGIDHQS